jgi:4-hydroxy-tetrahydrodipicolinate synthase
MWRLHGIFAATVTAFTADDRVDEMATRKLIRSLMDAGIHGVIPTGSTGEFSSMTLDERKRVADIVIETVGGKIPVLPHTGAIATREVIDLSVHAQRSGASGLMIVPPFYEPMTEEEVRAHYAKVAEAVDLPIMLYNIPGCTGFTFQPEFVLRLADEIPSIRYLKDTTGDARALQSMLTAFGERILVFNGWDTLSFLGLAAGTAGCVWGAANVMPRECVALYDLITQKKDLNGARDLWGRMFPANLFFEREGYVAAVKAGATLAGWPTGNPRSPIKALGPAKVQELRELLRPLNLLA